MSVRAYMHNCINWETCGRKIAEVWLLLIYWRVSKIRAGAPKYSRLPGTAPETRYVMTSPTRGFVPFASRAVFPCWRIPAR